MSPAGLGADLGGEALQLDARAFLNLLFDEALREVLEEIDREAACSRCRLLRLGPGLRIANRVEEVVIGPAKTLESEPTVR